MELKLNWMRDREFWYDFKRMNWKNVSGNYGIYCVFTQELVTIYVGSGDIADRLLSHQEGREGSQKIREFQERMPEVGDLLVTWAEVASTQYIGVERYLHLPDVLDPIISKGPLYGNIIEVNTPF